MGHIIIVGAGQAGASVAARLRNNGFDCDITIVGAEPVPPYQRPPLSKAYLLGDMTMDRLFLRSAKFYEDQGITLRMGQEVTRIEPQQKQVFVGEAALAYDHLVLTTGSEPRYLPDDIGAGLGGVYVVRGLADIDAMSAEFKTGKRALIVGGGYIGLEVAAVAAKLGIKVTLVEMADRILQRVAAPETSGYFQTRHRAEGIDLREGVGLERLLGETRVSGAQLTDGSILDVDFVVTGVGIVPSDTLAAQAGLTIENGIWTDSHGRTSDPHIWAAGDCASFPWRGDRIRLESVQNAIDQAELVADNLTGANKDYIPHPWFWSDQYDVKLQIAGINTGYNKVVVRHGERHDAVSHWYYRDAILLAVDAINDPRAYMVGKRLIEAGKSPTAETIADLETDLKSLLMA